MLETVEICAICEVICALSSGFIGSWLASCATSNLRKRSSDRSAFVPAALVLVVALVLPLTAVVVVMVVFRAKCGVYWPICSVLSSSDLAVFMTSTLFWYEREAEIMLTISSTVLTLDWFT